MSTRPAQEVAAALKGTFQGDMLSPGDAGFESARGIWNAVVARTPGLILRCADVADVQRAVRSAAAAGALTAIRCGGHSLAGFSTCQGGVVIDLSRLRQVTVDPAHRRARAAGGCLLGTIDTATQEAGLAYPAGVVSHTGASGLILGGGTGWLTRLHGLSCDNVEGFTLVTAEGSLVHAGASENADLFWALRGGGGNFGVVTEFELGLHPLRSLLIGSALCLGDNVAPALRFWRDYMPGAPEELKWNVSLIPAPDCEDVPVALRGRVALTETVIWLGDAEKGRKYLDQALSVGHPVMVKRDQISYLALQTMADSEFPHGGRYYTKSGYFAALDDHSIDVMVSAIASIPSPKSQIEVAYLGGAASRVDAAETAFGDRSAPFITNLLASWTDAAADAANVSWIRTLFKALRPAMRPGVYINFMSGDEDDRTTEAYGARWERLLAVKRHYDPQNFFRLNQNITDAKRP